VNGQGPPPPSLPKELHHQFFRVGSEQVTLAASSIVSTRPRAARRALD
jgi:hypothetical protein